MTRRVISSGSGRKHSRPAPEQTGRRVASSDPTVERRQDGDADRIVSRDGTGSYSSQELAGGAPHRHGIAARIAGWRSRRRRPRRVLSDAADSSNAHAVSSPGADARSVTSRASDRFVDARSLPSEDLVTQTLQQTSGSLGMVSRPKIVDFNARLQERRRASARVAAIRIGIVVVSLAAIAGLVWLLFFSSALRLETDRIEVRGGNEWVSTQRILDIANHQAGKSLLLVSSAEVTTQLNDIPGVTTATAQKQYPKGLLVTVKAQKPAAMLKAGDGSLTAVDGKGRILNSVKDVSITGIPVIEVGNVNDGLRNRAVLSALQILNKLPEQMRHRISKVSARTQDSITTELDDGRYVIVWGDDSDYNLKEAVVDKIINDPTKIGDKHQVDVSAPLRPIIK